MQVTFVEPEIKAPEPRPAAAIPESRPIAVAKPRDPPAHRTDTHAAKRVDTSTKDPSPTTSSELEPGSGMPGPEPPNTPSPGLDILKPGPAGAAGWPSTKPGPEPKSATQSIGDVLSTATQRETGDGGGPRRTVGGLGELYSRNEHDLPLIHGNIGFGRGKKGALRGKLCFIDPGTTQLKNTRCTPVGILYADELNVEPRRFTHGFPGVSERFEWFALDFGGKFHVSRTGRYQFRLLSDDGAILWIDGTIVIDNDGQHPPLSKINSVELDEGAHKMRVLYFQGPRTQVALQLFVTVPGSVERLWTPDL